MIFFLFCKPAMSGWNIFNSLIGLISSKKYWMQQKNSVHFKKGNFNKVFLKWKTKQRKEDFFMVKRTQLKFINHLFLRLQIYTLCMENKVYGITFNLQNIRSVNIIVTEIWSSSKKKKKDKKNSLVPHKLK